ncbi:MAG: rhomboid family intramembrane serine protease [Chloracidobacterium sp.]|nr:rhomboid family intramembrane serine protease [Chloracidobacterium sp.]
MSLKYQTEDVEPEVQDTQPARNLGPTPYYTIIFIAAIVAVALVQLGTGLEASILAAGFVKPALIKGHEYWRILTGATTHGSVLHVAMNCYAFYSFGKIFEMLSNRAHLAIVFLLSAIGGGILSLVFQPDGISVGASGGIVGLIGYLAVYAFRRRQFISPEFRKSLLINIGFILVFGLVLYQVIDNFGHIGGLITGAVYGFLQIPSDEHIDPREAGSVVNSIGLAALGIYIAACGFSILLILQVV